MQINTAAKNLIKAIKRTEKLFGAYSFNYYGGNLRVLVGPSVFEEIAQGREISLIESSLTDSTWKKEVKVEGVTFVTLISD